MTALDDREKGFEAQFKHGEELRFRIHNRRNKLLGHWAAGLMKLPAPEVEAYVRDVVEAGLSGPGEPVHDRVHDDLHRHGIDLSDHRLQRKMDELLAVAREQVMSETKAA
ncbi:MAG: DUF1476 domain-containing protein [Rhodospirillaceae bacterium]|nr:DUF1476 domain-containing protein [Rhodospirillaceae bacterium]